MVYYIEKDNEIVLFDSVKKNLKSRMSFFPQYADLEIQKSESGEIVAFEGKYYFSDDPNYIALAEAKERERILALSMTRSDFFDGTIKAFGADSDDLLQVLSAVMATLPISDLEKKVALNNYKNALNFYRKHTLFTLLSGTPLPMGGQTVVITSEQWDRFFDETNKRNPNAYRELLPQE